MIAQIMDPRMRWFHQLAFIATLLLVPITLLRMQEVSWGDRLTAGWYQSFVVIWVCVITYAVRTVGTRELIRFWLTGFFTTIMLTYVVTAPVRSLLGPGNLHTAVWVPIAEEVVKILPVIAWTTFMRPKQRHAALSDFFLVGLVIGAGFAFHEDALYVRQKATGFDDGLLGLLFPNFYRDDVRTAVVHAGWTALAALGVGVVSLYRRRKWAWPLGAALLLAVTFDHSAGNWRGSDVPRTIMANGQVVMWIFVVSLIAVVLHDCSTAKWTTKRDNIFARPTVSGDFAALRGATADVALARVLWRQRYRRLRNATFTDLYAARSRGVSAGDRKATMKQLAGAAQRADVRVDPRFLAG